MENLLAEIEKCAMCDGINFNGKTTYADEAAVPCEESAAYLGAMLSRLPGSGNEVSAKISQCYVILQNLQTFSEKSELPHML